MMNHDESIQCFQDLLSEFARRTGLESLTPDEDNGCRIIIDGQLPLDIDSVPETGALFLHAPLCDIPTKPSVEFFRTFLEASLFGSQTLGANFGIDSDTNEIILFREMSLGATSPEQLENEMTDFIATLDTWKERVAPHHQTTNIHNDNNQAIRA